MSTYPHDPHEVAANFAQVAEKTQKVWQEFLRKQQLDQGGRYELIDPFNVMGAFTELFTRLIADPNKLMHMQLDFWESYVQLLQSTTERLLGEQANPAIAPDKRDRRFQDRAWEESTIFDFIKQSYLLTAQCVQQAIDDVEDMDQKTRQKVEFYTKQYVDAMSPSNFVLTNPEVLRATIESNGENIVHGLQNLLEDIERSNGVLNIKMTDLQAFEIGKNLATTPGKVVYENDLMQLIQYEPKTKEVYQRPVLIIPAWINKYYILDMREDNSYIRWMLEQGYTVFVISWVNPNKKLAEKTFEHYLMEGPLEALDAIEKATGETEITAIGYCLGGTLLATTLAYLHAKKQSGRIKAATYFTTMTDFSSPGDLGVFIDDEQLKLLEAKLREHGCLEGQEMQMTFNMLRANDLIWSFVVNNYLLGKDPFPFDLLYWNSDSTRMPAQMHMFYLRNMYQKNLLVKPGAITLAGVPIDLGSVKTPTYMLSTREDHIAPWKETYKAVRLFSGPVHFTLAASGHIAGVINPPTKSKYGYWTNQNRTSSADSWLRNATEHEGSWWPDWDKWNAKHSGPKVPARKPGDGKLKVIEDAPGRYVKERS